MTEILNTRRYRKFSIALAFVTGLSLSLSAYSAASDTQVSFSVLFDDNITRTHSGDKKFQSDQAISLTINQPFVLPVSKHVRINMTGSFGVEQYVDLNKLSNISGGVQAEVQYRSSAEFGTPIFGLFAKYSLVEYDSDQRDGTNTSYGFSVRKTLTDRINFYGAAFHRERDGQHTVFKNQYDGGLLNIDYDLRGAGTIYLGGEYRDGSMAIGATPEWDWYNTFAPNDITKDDVISIWSYRVNGTTQIFKAGYNLPFSESSAIDFSWRSAESSVSYWTDLVSGITEDSYTANQYSVAYMLRF